MILSGRAVCVGIFVALASGALPVFGQSPPRTAGKHAYTVGAFHGQNEEEANNIARALAHQGLQPMTIEKSSAMIIAVGLCLTYAEAEALQGQLKSKGFVQTSIIEGVLEMEPVTSCTSCTFELTMFGSKTPIFGFPTKLPSLLPSQELLSAEAIQRAKAAAAKTNVFARMKEIRAETKSTTAVLAFLENSWVDIPEEARADAAMSLGNLRGATGASKNEVIAAFRPVADGTLPAPRLLREQAAVRIAHQLRYGKNAVGKVSNEPVEAMGAFQEVALVAIDDSVRSEAATEAVALTLEAVKGRGKGSWDDVVAEAKRARQRIPDTMLRNRATVDLMVIEAFYYSRRYNEAVAAAENFFQDYPDQKRELGMARIATALAYRNLDEKTRAVTLLKANIEDLKDLQKGEYFADLRTGKKMDPRSMSLQWLVVFARWDKNTADEEHYMQIWRSAYPHDAAKLIITSAGAE